MVDEIAVGVLQSSGPDDLHSFQNYADPVISRARIEEKISTVRAADGTSRKVNTVIATTTTIKDGDRVWLAPFVSNDAPRVFPVNYEFTDVNARSPVLVGNARKMSGGGGHFEVWF